MADALSSEQSDDEFATALGSLNSWIININLTLEGEVPKDLPPSSGQRKWYIDYVRPVASFDRSDPRWPYEAFHYSNLEPRWAT
jgi:hypothetical protein